MEAVGDVIIEWTKKSLRQLIRMDFEALESAVKLAELIADRFHGTEGTVAQDGERTEAKKFEKLRPPRHCIYLLFRP